VYKLMWMDRLSIDFWKNHLADTKSDHAERFHIRGEEPSKCDTYKPLKKY